MPSTMAALRCVSSKWLAEKLTQQENSIVVLDLRKPQDFLGGHVRSSVNLPYSDAGCRIDKDTSRLEQLLVATASKEDRERLATRTQSESVVLYDQGSTEERKDESLVAVADLLVAEKCHHVCFVDGGFSTILTSQKEIISPTKKGRNFSRPKIAPLSLPTSSEQAPVMPKLRSGAVPSTRGLISEVLPGVYLGDEVNAEDRACMLSHGITDVFNVTSDLPNVFEGDKTLQLNYTRFAVTDVMTSDLQLYFQKSHELIDQIVKRKGRVLVHCLAGISRSPTLVIAYIMRSKRWSFDTTFDFVRLRKSNVNPNFGFLQQLHGLEEELSAGGPLARLDADALSQVVEKMFEKAEADQAPNGAAHNTSFPSFENSH